MCRVEEPGRQEGDRQRGRPAEPVCGRAAGICLVSKESAPHNGRIAVVGSAKYVC